MMAATVWAWVVDGAGYLFLLAVASSPWWIAGLKSVASKWLDKRFAEKLMQVEQQHDVMIRHLQSTIDREFDRAVRLHTEEFKALSKGWIVLHDAYWRARTATGRGYQIHDFTRMSEAQAKHFIENADFPEWRKAELRAIDAANDRNKYYLPAWRWKQYGDCSEARTKLIMFIDRKAIFMQPEIREKFSAIENLIDDALLEFKLRIEDGDAPHGFNEFIRADALKDGETQYIELQMLIHTRIWSSTLQAPVTEAA
jgi:hypothetical protein